MICLSLEVPVKLAYPVDQLMRAVFTDDQEKVEKRCQDVESKTMFLVNLAMRAARCTHSHEYRRLGRGLVKYAEKFIKI